MSRQLAGGLPVFDSRTCANSAPALSDESSEPVSTELKEAVKLLIEYHVANRPGGSTNEVPAPPCKQQGPSTFNGQTSQFPHATPFK